MSDAPIDEPGPEPKLGTLGKILTAPLVPFVVAWEAVRAVARASLQGCIWRRQSAAGR